MPEGLSYSAHHPFTPRLAPALDNTIAEVVRRRSDSAAAPDTPLSALFLPEDATIVSGARVLAERLVTVELKYLVVIGIGGSNLGAKAVYDALVSPYASSAHRPHLIFLETLSGAALRELLALFGRDVTRPEEILINVVSKSGNTVESVANFRLLYDALMKSLPGVVTRVVVTSDVGSALWKEGSRQGFHLLPVPPHVGGRYSVFTAVGIFPLIIAGVDVDQFTRGGRDMLLLALESSPEKNIARRSAEELFAAMGEGCSIVNIFHFNPECESLGKWERQLIAESLGKAEDRSGKTVHAGVTPLVSVGSTDLHSMVQLYLGGPRDKFTLFVRAGDSTPLSVPADGACATLVDGISGKTSGEIMEAILSGVTAAYEKNELPFSIARFPECSSYTLGFYMEWRMATVIYLAELMNVNAFDQPAVEDYKSVTRNLLKSPS